MHSFRTYGFCFAVGQCNNKGYYNGYHQIVNGNISTMHNINCRRNYSRNVHKEINVTKRKTLIMFMRLICPQNFTKFIVSLLLYINVFFMSYINIFFFNILEIDKRQQQRKRFVSFFEKNLIIIIILFKF